MAGFPVIDDDLRLSLENKLAGLDNSIQSVVETLGGGIDINSMPVQAAPTGIALDSTLTTLLAKGTAVSTASLPVVLASDQAAITVKSSVVPSIGSGYSSTHCAYYTLDGGAGTVSVTGSGDYVTAAMGKVTAMVRTTAVSLNNLHINSDVDCWITLYNISSASTPPTVGLQTSIKHRFHILVGANTFPVKDELFASSFAYTITKFGQLGNTGAVTGTITININYIG